jgi:hypothetical protein
MKQRCSLKQFDVISEFSNEEENENECELKRANSLMPDEDHKIEDDELAKNMAKLLGNF